MRRLHRYAIFCFDQVYIKHAVDSVPVESNWGRVFYTNFWASLIMAVSTVATEPEVLLATAWTPATVGALSVSCLLGVAMSYFAFLCRAAVSATSFTVIGNVCKVLTVLINVFIWDKHASKEGLAFLFFCLIICLIGLNAVVLVHFKAHSEHPCALSHASSSLPPTA